MINYMINHGTKFWENVNVKEFGILSPDFIYLFQCYERGEPQVQKVEWIFPLNL